MEAIKTKIKELLKVSAEDLMTDEIIKSGTFGKLFDAKMERQEELMNELKTLAKAKKTLLGRTVQFPMADSYALYLITSVNKTTVTIEWLNWCDGWVDDRAGYKSNLSLKYAEQTVYGRDRLDEMFSNKKLTNV